MIPYRHLRNLFEGRLNDHPDDPRAGHRAFLSEFYDTMGVSLSLREGRGLKPSMHLDERGLPYRPPGSAQPDEVGIRHLAEALMGHEFVEEYYHPSGGFDFSNRQLLEAAIDPASFLNISTFNLSIAGLVNAQIIERFNQPDFIGRNLVRIMPTSMNGQKFIGAGRIPPASRAAKGRKPGEAHTELSYGEQFKALPETVEQAAKVKLTREAVYFDLTGQVLEEAGNVGDELAYGQDKDIADTVLGVTGLASTYNFGGTSYEVYQATSPWVNDLSNPFADETDVDEARQLFVGMTDPTSGKEVRVEGRQILCPPAKELLFRQMLFGTNVQLGTQLNSSFPSRWTMTGESLRTILPYTVTPLTSIWFNRMTAADGLALSATNAKLYWYIGDFQKAFYWMENWPLTPWQASADELVMKDQGLAAVYGANYRGSMFSYEPRYVVRSKN